MELDNKILAEEKKLLRQYVQLLGNDPEHFTHYWLNSATQVVAFSFNWEIAGSSEEDIWNNKLSPEQKKQVFFWVYPPNEEEVEATFLGL